MPWKSAKPCTVTCPACSQSVAELDINRHLDNNCSGGSEVVQGAPCTNRQLLFSNKQESSKAIAPIFGKKRLQESSPSQNSEDLVSCFPTERPIKRVKSSATNSTTFAPLAERFRPQNFADFVGQEHLIGSDSPLQHLLQGSCGSIGSLILWGPSGSGKTTLARLLARRTDAILKELSATNSGTNDVRTVFEEAKKLLKLNGRQTILFLDEIHRFNKTQQDIFLPYLEHGHVQLIGATTENPSFKITSALLSRCRVFVLEQLTESNIIDILDRAIARISSTQSSDPAPSSSPQGSSQSSTATMISSDPFPQLTPKIKASIASLAGGDARTALSLLELILSSPPTTSEAVLLANLRRSVSTRHDRTGDSHYDMISALQKSVRGSDGSGALYWLARMLTAGEDPLYIARRLIVMASEDIGLANNGALSVATATLLACQHVGMPECRINLAHCVAHLAESPKSTRAYEAYNRAEAAVQLDPTVPVPMHLRNAPTRLMKELQYGKDYAYNPAFAHPVHQEYLPPHLLKEQFLKVDGDLSGKVWNEKMLEEWEKARNFGKQWDGRKKTGKGDQE